MKYIHGIIVHKQQYWIAEIGDAAGYNVVTKVNNCYTKYGDYRRKVKQLFMKYSLDRFDICTDDTIEAAIETELLKRKLNILPAKLNVDK